MQYGAMAYARPLAQCIQMIQHIHVYMGLVTLKIPCLFSWSP